jgi:hypothetical protein
MILQAGRRIRGIVAAGARCDNSTMKPPRWSLRTMFLTIAIFGVALVVFVSPALKQPSNCGGNSEALNDVKLYALTLQWAAEARSDHQFDIASATLGQLKELRDLASGPAGARYLVSPQPYRHPPTGQKRIVIVCDRTFTNVPRRLVGRAPPTHAVAYSDGSCGLISVADFEALDRSGFMPLDELLDNAQAARGYGSSP